MIDFSHLLSELRSRDLFNNSGPCLQSGTRSVRLAGRSWMLAARSLFPQDFRLIHTSADSAVDSCISADRKFYTSVLMQITAENID